jgi:hypothetical protein
MPTSTFPMLSSMVKMTTRESVGQYCCRERWHGVDRHSLNILSMASTCEFSIDASQLERSVVLFLYGCHHEFPGHVRILQEKVE